MESRGLDGRIGSTVAEWGLMSRDGTDPLVLDATIVALDGEDSDGSELLGQVIDNRYRLESMLGRGGMGLVYRAAHMGLRRQVAVKILHPSLAASSDVRSRFEREALAVGKIDHPNCVSVYDVGRLPDGSLYLAMELLEGKSLADVLESEGQLAPGRALHILAHILRGLSHIHGAGLIHRDIKPENIFLIRQGSDVDFAKILDFGIAKPIDGRAELDDGVKLTQAGMAFGTPIYMAPEQALGNPMDGRADLYAAAVMGYEMLAGTPPFYSDDKLEVMSMHTAKPVPPMRQRVPKGGRPPPASIERLIAKGLTKKPSERYRDADVFIAAVEEALKTPDGGVTDVQFERVDTTGSSPLVVDGGEIRSADAVDDTAGSIDDAISDALSTPPPGLPVAPKLQTPPRGLPQGVALGQQRGATPRGGVGLGLPYTGPQGEPIFGLTPEQRLAQAAGGAAQSSPRLSALLEPETRPAVKQASKKWVLYAAIAAVAIVVGVVIAVVTAGGEDDGGEMSAVAAQANEALFERGDPARAIAILEQNKATIEQDATAQLVLGHAHAAQANNGPALDAYTRALEIDPTLEEKTRLRANLRTMAAVDKDLAVVARAFDLWVRTQDPAAKQALANAAISDDIARRAAVVPVIERHKLVDTVDWWVAYSLDLEQGTSCESRKEAVSKLRALGDKRAVEALERAMVRRGKWGATRGKLINTCLVEDAKAAIGYLAGLPGK